MFPIKIMMTVSSVHMDPGSESEIRPRPVRISLGEALLPVSIWKDGVVFSSLSHQEDF